MATPTTDQQGIHDAAAAYNGLIYNDNVTPKIASPSSTLNRSPNVLQHHSGSVTPLTPNHHIDISEPLAYRHRDNTRKVASPHQSETASREKESKSKKTTLSSGRTHSSFFSQDSWVPSGTSSAFMLTVLAEAAVVIALVATVFARILLRTRSDDRVQDLKTNSVYFSLIIFGMIFLVLIALDANRLKNTIQVIGVAVFNVALIVVAALEIPQVHKALRLQDESGAGVECHDNPSAVCSGQRDLFPSSQRYLIVVAVLIGVAQFPITYFAYKLWSEWGWRIYKAIGADLKLRRQYLAYQVLVVLLKFDFFFGLGFSMSYLILIADRNRWQFPVNIAALPLAVLILFLCALAVRREWILMMILSIIGFIAGEVYFIYQLTRIYASSTSYLYNTVRLTLTFFSVFAILFLLLTLINSIICLSNFGKGLREAHAAIGHVVQPRQKQERDSIDGTQQDGLGIEDEGQPHQQMSSAFGASRLSLD